VWFAPSSRAAQPGQAAHHRFEHAQRRNQHAACERAVGFVDRALAACGLGGMLRWHEAELGHQLERIVESPHVAGLATSAEATISDMLRIAGSVSTGAMLQAGTRSQMRPVRRSKRASSSFIASRYSWQSICWVGCGKVYPISRCRTLRNASTMSARALTRSCMAPCSGSGIQTGVTSPPQYRRASAVASHRSLLIRSSDLRGIRFVAITTY
jgi:hypothetical protein